MNVCMYNYIIIKVPYLNTGTVQKLKGLLKEEVLKLLHLKNALSSTAHKHTPGIIHYNILVGPHQVGFHNINLHVRDHLLFMSRKRGE